MSAKEILKDLVDELDRTSMTENQKYHIVFKLLSFFAKEEQSAQNTLNRINDEVENNVSITYKKRLKKIAEKDVIEQYQENCKQIKDRLAPHCSAILDSWDGSDTSSLTANDVLLLKETLLSPNQCDDANTRSRFNKLLRGFEAKDLKKERNIKPEKPSEKTD